MALFRREEEARRQILVFQGLGSLLSGLQGGEINEDEKLVVPPNPGKPADS